MTEITMRLAILGITLAVVALIVFWQYLVIFGGFLPGYRGAVGFKNLSDVEIATARLSGLSRVVDLKTLMPHEHSINFPGRVRLPSSVQITWRTAPDAADRTAHVSLAAIPSEAKDGEIFFVFTMARDWAVEFSPELEPDKR
jgi:hypothetical protein